MDMSKIDLLMVFGSDTIQYFKDVLMSSMHGELAVCASGSSTEEDQKAYTRLQSCLSAEIEFDGMQIKAKFGIDRDKLSSGFLEKNSGLIDMVESNMNTKNQFFLETAILDKVDEEHLAESIAPYLYEQINATFGGEVSA